MSIEPTSDPLAPTPSPGSHADLEGLSAREILAQEYEKRFGEGPYPVYAELARTSSGSFTLCAIRAVERALAGRLVSRSAPGAVGEDVPSKLAAEIMGLDWGGLWREAPAGETFEELSDFLHGKIQELIAAALAASPTAPAGEPVAWAYEWRHRYPDGDDRWFLASCVDRPMEGPRLRNIQPLGVISTAPAQGGDGWCYDMDAAPREQQPILVALDSGKFGDIRGAPAVAFWSERANDWRHWHGEEIGLSARPVAWQRLPPPASPSKTPEG